MKKILEHRPGQRGSFEKYEAVDSETAVAKHQRKAGTMKESRTEVEGKKFRDFEDSAWPLPEIRTVTEFFLLSRRRRDLRELGADALQNRSWDVS